ARRRTSGRMHPRPGWGYDRRGRSVSAFAWGPRRTGARSAGGRPCAILQRNALDELLDLVEAVALDQVAQFGRERRVAVVDAVDDPVRLLDVALNDGVVEQAQPLARKTPQPPRLEPTLAAASLRVSAPVRRVPESHAEVKRELLEQELLA